MESDRPSVLRVGQKLSHYRILGQLGAGGMGEVYLAEDTNLKREVAIKVLPTELAGSSDRLERFQREAEAVAALNHPNIVTIHSVERADAIHFLTMDAGGGEDPHGASAARGISSRQVLRAGAASGGRGRRGA